MRLFAVFALLLGLLAGLSAQQYPVGAPNTTSQEYREALKRMGIDQNLGGLVDQDADVVTDTGQHVKFGSLLGKRPVIVLPMFYTCKSACGLMTDNLLRNLVKIDSLSVGVDFDVVMVGLRPVEGPDIAAAKKASLLSIYDRPGAEKGFHFLTGSYDQIQKLARSLGYRYSYNAEKDQVLHPAGLMILTEKGMISRYMFGVDFPQEVLRRSILAAKRQEVGSKAEPIMFGCIMVDPVTGQRTLNIRRTLEVLGMLTVAIVAGSIIYMSRKHRDGSNYQNGAQEGAKPSNPA